MREKWFFLDQSLDLRDLGSAEQNIEAEQWPTVSSYNSNSSHNDSKTSLRAHGSSNSNVSKYNSDWRRSLHFGSPLHLCWSVEVVGVVAKHVVVVVVGEVVVIVVFVVAVIFVFQSSVLASSWWVLSSLPLPLLLWTVNCCCRHRFWYCCCCCCWCCCCCCCRFCCCVLFSSLLCLVGVVADFVLLLYCSCCFLCSCCCSRCCCCSWCEIFLSFWSWWKVAFDAIFGDELQPAQPWSKEHFVIYRSLKAFGLLILKPTSRITTASATTAAVYSSK